MSMSQEEIITTNILQMKEYLLGRGFSYVEAERAAIAYYSQTEPPNAESWPGEVTGIDLMPQINPLQVFDSGSPPYFQPNTEGTTEPYPTFPTPDPLGAVKTNNPKYDKTGSNIGHTYQIENHMAQGDQTNWLGLQTHVPAEPPTLGAVPWNTQQSIQPWRYNVEEQGIYPDIPNIAIYPSGMLNETEPELMEYVYQNHDSSDICYQFAGKTFDMNDRAHRPVPPSEGLGYTNTHPNCICYWKPSGEITATKAEKAPLLDLQTIHRKIGAKSHAGTLHKVKKDGDLSQRTGHRNYYRKPLKMIQEAIAEVRHEFNWLGDDYLMRARAMADEAGGRLYLIRASQETITDHRAEGEPYRRLLSGDELRSMSRTAIGHGMDIDHNPQWRTNAIVLDSEYDEMTRSIQMLILETDPEINRMIDANQITAVSINGGSPRAESVEPCNHGCSDGSCELCVVPRGVVLGEQDDIALTWVVTDPRGVYWRGQRIPFAEPGVKTTIIQPV